MASQLETGPASSRAETTRLPTISAPADARPTVELKPFAKPVEQPAAPPPTPYRAIGAYSVKKRATSHSDATARAPGLPDCEVLELLDGGVKFRAGDQVCKLSTADARALGEMLLRAAK